MPHRIREILLISTPYDAWILEEDCRISERIISEYRGLNLSDPPRFNWVASDADGLAQLTKKKFDLVIIVRHVIDKFAMRLARQIKTKFSDLPLVLLTHGALPPRDVLISDAEPFGFDRVFLWTGNTDLLLALIKSIEDQVNVGHDTELAGIRVILFVEDSSEYISSLMPILYRELVSQTQRLLEKGLNEDHRLLTMRARPKILLAQSYEEAGVIYQKFEPFILGVVSDVSFPRNQRMNDRAGIDLLQRIKKERFDVPLLLTSSEPSNAELAAMIPAAFVDKNSPSLLTDVRTFLLNQLGFGDFIFFSTNGKQIGRATDLLSLEKMLAQIPEESFYFHWKRNDFSRWLFARAEIVLASKIRPATEEDFAHNIDEMRDYLIKNIRQRRRRRQKGIVVDFGTHEFDLDTEFFKIGKGSLGGKARGLAFMSEMLKRNAAIHRRFEPVAIGIPQTVVITTDAFEAFVDRNNLKSLAKADLSDQTVAQKFVAAKFFKKLRKDLKAFLSQVRYPLSVRSSSILEDAQFRAYAGLYKTYMLANDHPDLEHRLNQLLEAIKLVYASTYYRAPKAFARRIGHRTEEEKMAVILQKVIGSKCGNYFYPAISGVAQSYNYYPFAGMKSEEGIATIALGLGKTVMEGGKALRFAPRIPQILPQTSTVEDTLENSQQLFYALKCGLPDFALDHRDDATLQQREIFEALDESAVKLLTGTYIPEEHRIKDSAQSPGHPILTFAQVLKYRYLPLADMLTEILNMGKHGMGCQVELEFAVDIGQGESPLHEFSILQLRPMTAKEVHMEVEISEEDIRSAFCHSSRTLGNGIKENLFDVIYVKPDDFDPSRTPQIAREIGTLTSSLNHQGIKYILIGPGRWGSADRWLGIPVKWSDIGGVEAVVEISNSQIKAEPSQGSHFFHNITTLGIHYFTVSEVEGDFIDLRWLSRLPIKNETQLVAHAALENPLLLKVDGRQASGVILLDQR